MTTLLERRGDILDTKVPLLTRIKFPRVWKHVSGGIKIEDLQEDKFDEALEHIKRLLRETCFGLTPVLAEALSRRISLKVILTKIYKDCYLLDETLCKLSEIAEDNESIENYLKLIKWWMQDTQSLVAVKEDNGKIIGVLIERVLDLYVMKTMSRVMNYHGDAFRKMETFLINISKNVNISQQYNTEYYNQIFIWSVNPKYRNNGIGKALLQACIAQTKSFKLTILIGIFTSPQAQAMAGKEGFASVYEQHYNGKEKSQIVFHNAEKNESARLMTLNLDNTDYSRNKCEEILQKYKITRLLRRSIIKETKDK